MKDKIKETLMAIYSIGKLDGKFDLDHKDNWALPDLFAQYIIAEFEKENNTKETE